MILKNIIFNFVFIFIFSTNVNSITLDLGSTLLGDSGGGNFNLDETLELQDQILTDYLKGSSEFNKALVIIMDAYDLKDESAKLQSQQNFLDGSDIETSNFKDNMKEVAVLHKDSVKIIENKISSGAKLDDAGKAKLATAYPPFFSGLVKTGLAVKLGLDTFKSIKDEGKKNPMILTKFSNLMVIAKEVGTSMPKMIKTSSLLINYGKDNGIEIPSEAKKQQSDLSGMF